MNRAVSAFYRLHALSVYRKILHQETVAAFERLLSSLDKKPKKFLNAYSGFYSLLCENNFSENFAQCFIEAAMFDDNCFTSAAAAKKVDSLPKAVVSAALNDLTTVLYLGTVSSGDILDAYKYKSDLEASSVFLPSWKADEEAYLTRDGLLEKAVRFHKENGCGIFAKYRTFIWREDIIPVRHPDTISLSSLKGYEYQRGVVFDNTKAFMEGKTCNNCLLYGDKGTGKSSTVKAVANYFYQYGLRIVEVPKERLMDFPSLVDKIARIPMKFMIFIDDLSFLQQDESYASLKAVLEGGLAAKPKNAVIYATSNRRHIIKECFSDRQTDDVNRRDNMEESLSLSDRFGLSVCFSAPNKDKFLQIVLALAEDYGIKADEQELCLGAERFALERGGRSPRCAKQYIKSLFR